MLITMSWDNGSVIKLIDAYRTKEVLWNPSNRNYYNRLLKKDAWDELEIELERPVNDLKKKIDYLLAALRREKQKIAKSKTMGQGADDVYQPSWFAYQHMLFLLDRNKPRERLNTEGDSAVEYEEEEVLQNESSENSEAASENEPSGSQAHKNELSGSQTSQNKASKIEATRSQVSGNRASSAAKFMPPLPTKKPKRSVSQNDPILTEALQLMRSSAQVAASATPCTALSSALTSDRYQIYANYLASKFRAYSQKTFVTIEHQINNILYCADSGQYEWERGYQSTYSRTSMPETPLPNQNIANSEHPTSTGVYQSAYSRTPTPETPSANQNIANSEHPSLTGVYQSAYSRTPTPETLSPNQNIANSEHPASAGVYQSAYSRTPRPETPSTNQNIANSEHPALTGVYQSAYSRTPTPETPSANQNIANSEHPALTGVYDTNSMDSDDSFRDLIKFP